MNATPMTVPQSDPGAGYAAAKTDIDTAVQRALDSGSYVDGPETAAFEREFAHWLGTPHAVTCGGGTDALVLALRALDIGPGSAVVTASFCPCGTVAAIEQTGALPVLLDIEPDNYTIDPAELEVVLDRPPPGLPPTRAVIPVHLYGQAADMGRILPVCARHGVPVVEDASQAHGATWRGQRLGTLGRIGAFSFHASRNFGALGNAGGVVTADAVLADRMATLRQFGWRRRYVAEEPGMDGRMDEVQAAILRARLRHIDARNARRNAIAAAYDVALQGTGARPPAPRAGCVHVFHQYVIRVARRDQVQARLRAAGIVTAVHYPVPAHRQPAYAGRLPVGPSGGRASEAAADEVLSLPMYAELSDAQVDHVCRSLTTL